MKKHFISLLLVTSLLLGVVGCSNATSTPTPATNESAVNTQNVCDQDVTEADKTTYPVTITDQAGRSVTIEAEPQSIVSGYYISTSMLIALGQKDKLVGIEAKAGKRAIYKLSAPELIDLPTVGSAKEFDLEGCAALKPDVAILPKKLKDAADTLTELGIPVILVNPENQEFSNEAMNLIATVLNCQDQAASLSDFVSQQETYLNESLKNVNAPSVYFAGNSSVLSTAGASMYQSSLITLAGGENVASDLTDTYWVDVDYEQILSWNPDYIIIASDASYTVDDVLQDTSLADCTAIKEGHVYQLPGNAESWDSPVPGGILGAVWMAGVLHPELISEENCEKAYEEFYETFYGFTYTAE